MEARDLIEAHCADKILAHPCSPARSAAAATLDAAVELINFLSELGLHALLDPPEINLFLPGMNPGLQSLAHRAHPLAGIHREVGNQLKHRQGCERDLRAEILGERTAGETRPAIDQHAAAAADARATDKIKCERRIELLADLVQCDE